MEFSKYSSKKEIFLFDSFGFRELKEFIIQDNRNITDKIMYDLKKFNSVDKEIMLILVKISIKEYNWPFSRHKQIRKKTRNWWRNYNHLVDDQVPMHEKDTCGMYQIYFFVNLLKPLETIEIINDKKPKKKQWKNY